MGDTFTAIATGAESYGWNPAGVAWSRSFEGSFGYGRPYGLASLETLNASVAFGRRRYGIGASVVGFGDVAYRETTMAISLAGRPRRGLVGVGIGGRWITMGGTGLRPRGRGMIDIGLRIAGDDWAVAAVGWNATGHRVDILSQGSTFGLVLRVTPRVVIGFDIRKEVGIRTGASTGVEVTLRRRFVIRTGWGGYPERLGVGMGIVTDHVQIDVSFSMHSILGHSHRLSLAVR